MVKTILILAANPKHTSHLELDSEIRDIEDILKRSVYRDEFRLEKRLAVRVEDLQNAVLEVQPWIVHFCGHGSGSEGIFLETETGQPQLISTTAIADLFRLLANRVECVLLNACYSEVQAKAIVEHINYVIGMHQEIEDGAARAFTRGFYEALGNEQSIKDAYNFGCNRIQLLFENSTPIDRKAEFVSTHNTLKLAKHLIPILLEKVTPVKPLARYALVIGVGEYQSHNFSPLTTAANDAEAVAQMLEKYGNFQVERLPRGRNQQTNNWEVVPQPVTKEQIVQAIRTLVKERAMNSEALIYFTGHSLRIFDEWDQQKGFLVASDCELEFRGEKLFSQRHEIELEGLNTLIQKSSVKRLVMLLDCYHHSSSLERQLLQQTFTAFSNQDRYIIAAYPQNYDVKDNANQQHSVFTAMLLKGLSAENADSEGKITCHSLWQYLRGEAKELEAIQMGGGRSLTLVTHIPIQITHSINFNRKNPYRGLKAFDAKHKEDFYGRDQSVTSVLDRLNDSRFLCLIGASGCGKSSLVKAGLLPKLENESIVNNHRWQIEQLTPGNNPRDILIEKLTPLHQMNQPFVLFIDQVEEVFTLCKDDEQRRAFFRLIALEATDTQYESKIIVAIRGDFLDQCAEYSEIAELMNRTQPTTYLVEPLSSEELKRAITEPAKQHGVTFEPGLVSEMVKDVVNQPGALPLLQFALRQLWEECIIKPELPEPLLTWYDYQRIHGVGGALNSEADSLYNSFVSQEDRDFVQRFFLELVELGEEDKVTRRRVKRETLAEMADSPEQLQKVLTDLTQHRLIVVTTHKRGEDQFETDVEVTHEALLTNWQLLKKWIAENRENIRIERRFQLAFQLWRDSYHKSEAALLAGLWLNSVLEWQNKTTPRLSFEEQEFIRKSVEMQEREKQEELENVRRLKELAEARANAEQEKAQEAEARANAEQEKVKEVKARAKAEAEKAKSEKQRARTVVGSGLIVGLLLAGLGLSQIQKQELEKGINIGIVRTWTQAAQAYWDNNKQLEALMASVKALNAIAKIDLTQENEYLNQLQTVIKDVREYNRLENNTQVWSVSVSPTDGSIVAGNKDGSIKLWSPEGSFLTYIKNADEKSIFNLRFSPKKGKYNLLASVGLNQEVKLWSLGDKERNSTGFLGKLYSVYDVSFSKENNFIAATGENKKIDIWDINQRQKPIAYRQENTTTVSVDFSPNTESLLVYSDDIGRVLLWDWKQKKAKLIGENKYRFDMVRFSPNGNLIASGSTDGVINIWQQKTENWTKIVEVLDSNNQIYSLDFSPTGEFIATAGQDNIVKIWNVNEMHKKDYLPIKLKGHTQQINRVSFSANGKILASASNDNTVRLWKWQGGINYQKKYDRDYLLKYSCDSLRTYVETHEQNLSLEFKEYSSLCPAK
ncbi:diguanylate cyclase (plasmid) [Nostoc carneum NIES-2107]|nr:diguanylate cyclase [Nostoc carneum NIES-2107]